MNVSVISSTPCGVVGVTLTNEQKKTHQSRGINMFISIRSRQPQTFFTKPLEIIQCPGRNAEQFRSIYTPYGSGAY